MLTPDEHAAWQAYVAELDHKGVEVDLDTLIDVLLTLDTFAEGKVIAAALGVGTRPLTELAQRLTLQTRQIVQTGRVPD
jgi:hypothetical protein